MLVLLLVKDIEIVGEADYQTTETTRDELLAIPWADIIGMQPIAMPSDFIGAMM
ncbi:MAG: hypothetical protein AB1798_00020 [Spirochaetota bacterium]